MLAVLVGIAMSVVNSHRTFALSIDDIPTNLTGPIQTYDFTESSCESSSPDQYQYTAWMSPTSTPSDNSTLTEPSNQPFTQDLEYNELIFLCHTIVTPGAGQPTINPPILPTINPGYNSGNPPAANNTQFIPSAVYDTSGTNAYAVPYDAT
ncbi:MAG TPA: hypothetical protein VMR95_00425, partial [Candidatus Binatia bacterium]|nr:hypothetical protein [Candidatus Binatia bacterium]